MSSGGKSKLHRKVRLMRLAPRLHHQNFGRHNIPQTLNWAVQTPEGNLPYERTFTLVRNDLNQALMVVHGGPWRKAHLAV
jgi:hypothetical protein